MRNSFSQRHPLLFGLFLILVAVVLTFGAMAFFVSLRSGNWALFTTKVGVIHVRGTIDSSRRVTDWVERLARDVAVEAVLLRIDSPGGVVAPSQEIHAAVSDLTQHKPVVASMGAVAASGGYYIACAADRIVANPGTITGSIGVKAQLASFQELMQDIGVQDQTITSGPLKDAGSPTHPLTPAERDYFQKLVNDLHEQFVLAVAQGRNLEVDKVRNLADGRAYTGRQAKKLGLVDTLGGQQTALELVREIAKIKEGVTLVEGPEEESTLWSWILGLMHQVAGTRPLQSSRPSFSYMWTGPLPGWSLPGGDGTCTHEAIRR